MFPVKSMKGKVSLSLQHLQPTQPVISFRLGSIMPSDAPLQLLMCDAFLGFASQESLQGRFSVGTPQCRPHSGPQGAPLAKHSRRYRRSVWGCGVAGHGAASDVSPAAVGEDAEGVPTPKAPHPNFEATSRDPRYPPTRARPGWGGRAGRGAGPSARGAGGACDHGAQCRAAAAAGTAMEAAAA